MSTDAPAPAALDPNAKPKPRPRGARVPWARQSLSALQSLDSPTEALGQCGGGLGACGEVFGQRGGGLGQHGGGLGFNADALAALLGQRGGGLGLSPRPGAIATRIPRWLGRGYGYLPDLPDLRDHAAFEGEQLRCVEEFAEKIDAARGKKEKAPPFCTEYLRDAYQLAEALSKAPQKEKSLLKMAKERLFRAIRRKQEKLAAAMASKADAPVEVEATAEEAETEGDEEEKPCRVNLGDSGFLTAVEDQGALNSCTANAVIGLIEYLVKASSGETIDLSRLFLYKETRALMGNLGDTGAYIRTTIQALANVGVPPESLWPYVPGNLDFDPPGRLYSYARHFEAVRYKRIDGYQFSSEATLVFLLHVLAAGFPVAFGFPVYDSIGRVNAERPTIPFPGQFGDDKTTGGHAVLAVGFETDPAVNADPAYASEGALIIKNSWGESWGDGGFAYLPFEYVTGGLALDFWTVFNARWISTRSFKPTAVD